MTSGGTTVDPLQPGPLRWMTPYGELRARTVSALSDPVLVSADGRDLPVRPLFEVERDDRQIARVIARLRAQSTVGSGGPSTSSASTIV